MRSSLLLSLILCVSFSHAQNVGIGTASPGTKLDVTGAITLRETQVAISSNTATIPSNVSQVRLTGAATATIVVTAPAAPANAGQRLVIYNNTTGGYAATYGSTTIPNGIALEFVYTNSAWVATVPSGTSVSSVTSSPPLTTNNAATGAVTVNLTGIVPVANGGTNSGTALSGSSVMVSNGTGIVQGSAGTTTTVLHGNPSGIPAYGAVNLTTDVTGILPVANGGTGSATQGWVDLTTNQTAAGNKTWTGTGTFSNATYSALFTGGYVGIGTTSPVNTLQVEGNLHMDGHPIYLRTGPGDQYDLIKWNSSVDKIDMGGYSGVNLGYTSTGGPGAITDVLTVTNGGLVGIGTTGPGYTLDVVGNGRFNSGGSNYVYVGSGGGAYYGDGTNLVTQIPAGGNFYMANVGTDGTRVSQSNGTMRVGGPNQTSASLYVYGQVGVGTLSPNNTMEVNGAVRVDANPIYLNNGTDNNHYIQLNNSVGGNQNGPMIAGYYGTGFYSTAYGQWLGQIYDQQICSSRNCTYLTASGWMFTDDVYSQRAGSWLDNINDLDAIDAIKPMAMTDKTTGEKLMVNDPATLPAGVALPPNEDGRTAVSLTQMNALSIGAIRELRHETKTRDEAIESRLERVENLLAQITGRALGEIEFKAAGTAYKGMENYVIVDARITPQSAITIDGLSDYEIVHQAEGSFEIKFKTPPVADVKFTYSSKY